MLPCPEKAGNPDSCYDREGPWSPGAVWNKPVTERQTLRGPTHTRSLEADSEMDGRARAGRGVGVFHGDRASVWEGGPSWRGQWWRMHRSVTVPDAAEPCPEPWASPEDRFCVMCNLPQQNLSETRHPGLAATGSVPGVQVARNCVRAGLRPAGSFSR